MAIWYILWSFGMFYSHLAIFMAIWYILRSFGIFSPSFVCFNKKNLATHVSNNKMRQEKNRTNRLTTGLPDFLCPTYQND
jgi:hypothetical protein